MSLTQQISEQIKEAMRAKDEVRLTVHRALKTAFTNEAVAKGGTPQTELSDEDALVVITRESKKRKDSISQFRSAGREELASVEEAELKVIEEYLPTLMGKDEIRVVVEVKKAELGVTDKSGIGKLMSGVMAELKGKADGTDVKDVVNEVLG